jgi:hypothetical protein
MFIRIRRAQFLQIDGRGPGKPVVGKYRSSANHHAILNCHSVTDINHGVELYPIAYRDSVSNVGFLPDDALFTDRRGMPNVNVVPNGGSGTDLHTLLNESSWVNANCH